ncbi:hypothetical protein H0H81_010386 [Sphagnurus paluster]|uniref:Uncharacterized protein n=1 Tax=Sphagnurus paluster TaxID=117069 RepID=A0A9P7GI09_9AGAR|nr:hypothetical protein H0H81_010386 [Sphagnurus paluster]
MVCQRILESGLLKSKQERDSAVGYMFDAGTDMYKASSQPVPPSKLSDQELNSLVVIAHDEAIQICKTILNISIPKVEAAKPVKLQPLSQSAGANFSDDKDLPVDPEGYLSDDDKIEDLTDDEGQDEPETPSATSDDCSDTRMKIMVEIAASDVACYSALCDNLDDTLNASGLTDTDISTPLPHPIPSAVTASQLPALQPTLRQVISESGNVSIDSLIDIRNAIQSGTATKSERVVTVSEKFALRKVQRDLSNGEDSLDKKNKFSIREASQRLRVAQDLNPVIKKEEQKKVRQLWWTTTAKEVEDTLNRPLAAGRQSPLSYLSQKNVTALNPIQRDSYVIMRTKARFYIGQVLDLYKKGASSRYGSIDMSTKGFRGDREQAPRQSPKTKPSVHEGLGWSAEYRLQSQRRHRWEVTPKGREGAGEDLDQERGGLAQTGPPLDGPVWRGGVIDPFKAEHIAEILRLIRIGPDTTDAQREQIRELISEFADCFALALSEVNAVPGYEHELNRAVDDPSRLAEPVPDQDLDLDLVQVIRDFREASWGGERMGPGDPDLDLDEMTLG